MLTFDKGNANGGGGVTKYELNWGGVVETTNIFLEWFNSEDKSIKNCCLSEF